MIALAIAALAIAAGLVGLVAWLVYRLVAKVETWAELTRAHAESEGEAERILFELDQTRDLLRVANLRGDALEEELAHEFSADKNEGLAIDDVRGRVLRIARRWAEADRASAAGTVTAVSADPATGAPKAGVD